MTRSLLGECVTLDTVEQKVVKSRASVARHGPLGRGGCHNKETPSMKNRIVLAALAAIAMLSGVAHAERVRKEVQIPWLAPNSALPNGAFQTSSTPKPLASETLDTTGVFSLSDADVLGLGGAGIDNLASQDSVLVGYLVAYTDSSADGASTLTAATATIDASGDGQDWAVVGTSAVIAASDDPIVAFPLVLRPGLDHQNLLTNAPVLRVRFTSATGLLLACRLKLVYWAATSSGS